MADADEDVDVEVDEAGLDVVVDVVDELMEEALAPTWYTSSLLEPPQYSLELPAQAMLQPVKPSEAAAPPLEKALPQSVRRARDQKRQG